MSICECDVDYERPSVFRVSTHRAKKKYRCCECRSNIEIGEQYEYVFGVWSGDSAVHRTCEKCADLRESMADAGFCTPYFGGLKQAHEEYIDTFNPQPLTKEDNDAN